MTVELTNFSLIDPDRFRADFNAAHGQEVITKIAVGDPLLMETQVNAFLGGDPVFIPDGPLSRGITDGYWDIDELSTALGLNAPPGDTYVYPGPAETEDGLVWGDDQLGHVYTAIDGTALVSVGGTLNAGDGGDTAVLTMVESIDVSSLVSVSGNVQMSVVPSLTSLVMSSLAIAGGIVISGNESLISMDVSLLNSLGNFLTIESNPFLTVLDLSSLASIDGNFNVNNNSSLISIDVSALLDVSGNFSASSNDLHQASVDAVLVKLASLDGSGGTTLYENRQVNLSGGTNAAPGSSGLTAKATLEGRGCTLNVN